MGGGGIERWRGINQRGNILCKAPNELGAKYNRTWLQQCINQIYDLIMYHTIFMYVAENIFFGNLRGKGGWWGCCAHKSLLILNLQVKFYEVKYVFKRIFFTPYRHYSSNITQKWIIYKITGVLYAFDGK